ncbi:MAG: CocE/NonD family hydrolase, partial [Planctomycetes bacterium]|nr:CocE/NonD family hydrolase [Planctomycetota bacterium]
FAGHGYASLRVDLRGAGDSEGLLLDEYLPQEQDDGEDAIAWVARQPWCTGAVGMLGKSWGGFNALHIAARRPPALRAVISVCSTDDRYADDAHYMGGCLLNENLTWGSMLMALCAMPPDPELVGDDWRAMWQQRLAAIEPFPARWMAHPTRDDYWRHGSVGEDFGAVQVPVWAVSGWADGYSNAVLRLLAGLSCPRWGLIGPWAHFYPHEGVPGPAIGFLQEAVKFFGRWLRGSPNEVDVWPALRAWQQASARPTPGWPNRDGRWIAEPIWPPTELTTRPWSLRGGALTTATTSGPPAQVLTVSSPADVGANGGAWCGFGLDGDGPGDQRDDDARSLCFDSEVLTEDLAILGAVRIRLQLASDAPAAMLCARICEVFADGASARVTFALLDLTHRRSHEHPEPMPVGEPQVIELLCNDTAHVFAAGSRIRLALSTSYWPMVWPAPTAARLTVHEHGSELLLPVRAPRPEDDKLPPFAPPRTAPRPPFTDVHDGGFSRRSWRGPQTGMTWQRTELDLEPDGTPSRLRFNDVAIETGHGIRETYGIAPGDPLTACAEVQHRIVAHRPGLTTRIELRATLTAGRDAHEFAAELVAHEGQAEVARRSWRERVPRGGDQAEEP